MITISDTIDILEPIYTTPETFETSSNLLIFHSLQHFLHLDLYSKLIVISNNDDFNIF